MLIGREQEQAKLKAAYESEYSEFVAIYGRRRVGKTFLVREYFNYKFTFSHTGVSNKNTRGQLQEFYLSLKRQGAKHIVLPTNWSKAFDQLISFLESSKDARKVVFIDEMPWMDAPRSGFVLALEHFWNGWAAARRDILLVVCGSASSWIINKVLKNHGGLHNRVSTRIHLKPFTLHECESYAKYKKLGYSRMQIAEGYMVMGGVPFYWSKIDKSKSLAQNIDALFFSQDGEFRYEFDELYASLFSAPDKYLKIVEALGTKRAGMTRGEIVKHSGLEENGQLGKMLENLVYCGFVRKYCSIGKKVKDALFQLVDNYTLFYFQFIKGMPSADECYWSKMVGRPKYNTWCGLAFERLCLLHVRQIKAALGISGILADVYSWYSPDAQIDLLISRADNVIDVCEIKYSRLPYSITSSYREALLHKMQRFSESLAANKALQLVMITSNGLKTNQYSDIVNAQLTIDDLFHR